MHSTLSLAVVAILAACALAAPFTPSKSLNKRSFTVPVKPRMHVRRSPREEMARTYAKYGWEIILSPSSGEDQSVSSSSGDDQSANPFPDIFGSSLPFSSLPLSSFLPIYSSIAPYPTATPSGAPAGSSNSSTPSGTAISSSNEVASATSATGAASTSASSTSGSETGEVSATPEDNDSEYLSPVKIGTSAQTLNLDFDTGSADLWVFSSDLSSSESSGHSVFNPSKSSTWTDYSGGSWEISYGDGSTASGSVGFDTVNIGGATATKQAIELATAVSGSFESDTNNDGLVGLAFSSINTVQPQSQKTFFDNVKDQLEQYVFTANLEDNAAGTYTFGEIDSSQYSGEIHYTDVDNSNGFWQFDSNTYTIGGTQSQCSTCSPAIADTGTSLVLVDEDVAKAYYAKVSGASYNSNQAGYVFDCSADLPSFGVAIGDYTATIQGADLSYAEIGDGTCFGGVQGNQGEGIQILGDVLLKQFFAVFDGENTQFGVANKA